LFQPVGLLFGFAASLFSVFISFAKSGNKALFQGCLSRLIYVKQVVRQRAGQCPVVLGVCPIRNVFAKRIYVASWSLHGEAVNITMLSSRLLNLPICRAFCLAIKVSVNQRLLPKVATAY